MTPLASSTNPLRPVREPSQNSKPQSTHTVNTFSGLPHRERLIDLTPINNLPHPDRRRSIAVQSIRRSVLLAATTAVAALSMSACGWGEPNWDVRMQVSGPGDVIARFAGGDPQQYPHVNSFDTAENVGFGQNYLSVDHARQGTVCRIFVNVKLRMQTPVEVHGHAYCTVNKQG